MKKKTFLMVIFVIAIMMIAFMSKQVQAAETKDFSNLTAGDIFNKGDKINLPEIAGKHYEVSAYLGNIGGLASGEYEIGADTDIFDTEITTWKISYIKTNETVIMIDFVPTNYKDLSKINEGDILNKGDLIYYLKDEGTYYSGKAFEISFFNGNYGNSTTGGRYEIGSLDEPTVKSWVVNEINLTTNKIDLIPEVDLDFDDLENRMNNHQPIIKGERLAYDLDYIKTTSKDINIGVINKNGIGCALFDGVAPIPWEIEDGDGCDCYFIEDIIEDATSINVNLVAGYKINFNSEDVWVVDSEFGETGYSMPGRTLFILPVNEKIINVTVKGTNNIEVTKGEEENDVYYTFEMPEEEVTVNVEYKEEKQEEKQEEKDKTPKTGIENINYTGIVLFAVAMVTGTIVLIKKSK